MCTSPFNQEPCRAYFRGSPLSLILLSFVRRCRQRAAVYQVDKRCCEVLCIHSPLVCSSVEVMVCWRVCVCVWWQTCVMTTMQWDKLSSIFSPRFSTNACQTCMVAPPSDTPAQWDGKCHHVPSSSSISRHRLIATDAVIYSLGHARSACLYCCA